MKPNGLDAMWHSKASKLIIFISMESSIKSLHRLEDMKLANNFRQHQRKSDENQSSKIAFNKLLEIVLQLPI
jgi:hypothetical protein